VLVYQVLINSDGANSSNGIAAVSFMGSLNAVFIYYTVRDYRIIRIDTDEEQIVISTFFKKNKYVLSFKVIQSCYVEPVRARGPVYKSLYLQTSSQKIEISDFWVANLHDFESFCFDRFLTGDERQEQISRSKEVDKEQRQSILFLVLAIIGATTYILIDTNFDDSAVFMSIVSGAVMVWLAFKYVRMFRKRNL